jgi:predicted NBD/HSP70 family sugar kinase
LSGGNRILRPKSVRGANSAAVLQLLRRHQLMSRADLARRSGLTEGSVSRIISGLIKRKLVREDGAENSTGGRPGVRLRLDEYRIGIGAEIRRNESRMAAVTLSGSVVHSLSFPTQATSGQTISLLVQEFHEFLKRYGLARIEGLGVSVRGIVNGLTGKVELGNLPSWVGVPLKETLVEALNVPVEVDNNVRLAAIAEYNYGTLLEVRNSKSLLFAMVDEGIGTGLVLEGKLYCGPGYAAGEFGQMTICDAGGPAQLDGAGCLESLASSKALCDRYAVLRGKRGFAGRHDSRSRVSRICHLALAGEKPALEALAETCRYLGIGIANIVWGVNPDSVVLDSVLNEAWSIVAPLILEQFPKEKEVVNFRNLVLRPSSLGGRASMVGAATMPFQSIFTTGELNSGAQSRAKR